MILLCNQTVLAFSLSPPHVRPGTDPSQKLDMNAFCINVATWHVRPDNSLWSGYDYSSVPYLVDHWCIA